MEDQQIIEQIILAVLYLNGGEMFENELEEEVCDRIEKCDGYPLKALEQVKKEIRKKKLH